ncbi:MAG: efflux RND transporter periplasmic adaptor subunit [Planctomycetota bacterium]|jgi:RND family efflux transporter MFP subunit|nr:efflux RND transporter periplasmic adaptor subunit [Planctomycetota bacterium]
MISYRCFLALLVAALPVGSFTGCAPEKPKIAEAPAEVFVQAPVFTVEPVLWPILVRCQGALVADEFTTVSAKVAGRVRSVHFEIGDRVSANSILVELDSEDYQLQAEQADAQLAQARASVGLKPGDPVENLNPDNAPPVREARAIWDESTNGLARIRALVLRDAISDSDLEIAESAEKVASAKYASAQNGVREKIAIIRVQTALKNLAQQRLEETKVYTPMDSQVQSKLISVGTYVQPGQPLLSLLRTSKLRFRSSVPERYAHQIQVGQKVTLQFDMSGQTREAVVSRINAELDAMNRSLGFEVDIDNTDDSLKSGFFGEATIELDAEAKSIALPLASVQRFAGIDKVWKVIDGKVKEQVVLVGATRGSMAEIRSGVKEGEMLFQEASQGKAGSFQAPQK